MGEIKWHSTHVRVYKLFYNATLNGSVSCQVNEQRVYPISRLTVCSVSWFLHYYKSQYELHIIIHHGMRWKVINLIGEVLTLAGCNQFIDNKYHLHVQTARKTYFSIVITEIRTGCILIQIYSVDVRLNNQCGSCRWKQNSLKRKKTPVLCFSFAFLSNHYISWK